MNYITSIFKNNLFLDGTGGIKKNKSNLFLKVEINLTEPFENLWTNEQV